jgi:6-phosphogluconolactonase (cycloisomerase 2 family)
MKRVFTGIIAAALVLAAQFAAAQGTVYTATNGVAGNRILVLDRDARGSLSFVGSVATGGVGTGTGLGNQGGLVLSPDGRWLVVVNAASDDVSVFRVRDTKLELTSRVASRGRRPVSITIDRELVYVLNAGGAVGEVDTIAGFRLDRRGRLHAIPDAVQTLSGASTAPAQVSFTPDGAFLVVTERETNLIGLFQISDDGVAAPGLFHPSAGQTPFGFSFDRRGRLLVSEASGGAADAGSASSYRIGGDGALEVISRAVPTTESATCWLVVTENGRVAYTTNTGSGSVSAFRVDRTGGLTLRDSDGVAVTTGPGSAPTDAALSVGSRYLHTLNSGSGSISVFRVNGNGSLTGLMTLTGLPAGTNGLAAR